MLELKGTLERTHFIQRTPFTDEKTKTWREKLCKLVAKVKFDPVSHYSLCCVLSAILCIFHCATLAVSSVLTF